MNDFLKYTLASLLGVVLAGVLSVVMSLLILSQLSAKTGNKAEKWGVSRPSYLKKSLSKIRLIYSSAWR